MQGSRYTRLFNVGERLGRDAHPPLTLKLNGLWLEEVVSIIFNSERLQPALLHDFQTALQAFLRDCPEGEHFTRFITPLV